MTDGPLVLHGSSWDHPRGHGPMLATAHEYARRTHGDVRVEWTPRSLRAFGVDAVAELAAQFDLVLVDHPHVGTAAEAGGLVALDEHVAPEALAAIATGSPGRSYDSYEYDGHLWALPVDAACQVSVWRPDLLDEPPGEFDEVVRLAASGRVLWPLCDVDAAASFLSLMAIAGRPCGTRATEFADRERARGALALMREVADRSDARCLVSSPISVLDAMSCSDRFVYAPLAFGYVTYSRTDAPGRPLRFGDVPSWGGRSRGALLGGVGLAVSATARAVESAVDYARFVADGATQSDLYFRSGGQPAHGSAWRDPVLDQLSGGFFTGTAAAMAGAWTRPREPRFAEFQSDMIAAFATFATTEPDALLDDLERRYARMRDHAP
ncbi:MAG: extracellular solute-binding protein [Actinomycetota bacterium]|nr:extracellular solute-binding protein [Actinomycetota bacterium]